MTEHDEAQPKRRRRRRVVYPKRTELRLDDELASAVSEATALASERLGRSVSMSEIMRESLRNGCRLILREIRRSPGGAAAEDRVTREKLEELIDTIGELRREYASDRNNVNQIAKVANSTGQVVEGLTETRTALDRNDERLVAILGELIGVRDDEEDDEV